MKISYVNADHGIPLFGDKGASVHIQELIRAFAELGHEVRVSTARLGPSTIVLPAGVEKVRVAPPISAEIPAQNNQLPQQLKERRYQAIAHATEEHLINRHQDWPFDIIYERYSLWSAAGARAAKRLGIPCILEVNAPLLEEQARFRKLEMAEEAARIEAEAFSNASAVLAVSEEVAEYVLSHGGMKERTHVVPNGVDISRFNESVTPLPIAGLNGSTVIGFVGSLKEWHGIDILLDAFTIVQNEAPDAHLLIVGDGPMREFVKGYIRGAKLDHSVTMTGWLHHDDLPGVIRRMDIATAPYPRLDSFYFSPLKLFEYMAVGAPIVASRIGQVDTVIEDSRTGILSAPGNAADLAGKLLYLYRDPALRASLGRAAAQEALKYSWHGNAQIVISLAKSLRMAA